METKYPNVEVQLTGTDGNTGALMGKVSRGLKRAGVPETEIKQFREEVFNAGSYDGALQVMMSWVNVY